MRHCVSCWKQLRPGNRAIATICKLLLGRGNVVNAALEYLGSVYNS